MFRYERVKCGVGMAIQRQSRRQLSMLTKKINKGNQRFICLKGKKKCGKVEYGNKCGWKKISKLVECGEKGVVNNIKRVAR